MNFDNINNCQQEFRCWARSQVKDPSALSANCRHWWIPATDHKVVVCATKVHTTRVPLDRILKNVNSADSGDVRQRSWKPDIRAAWLTSFCGADTLGMSPSRQQIYWNLPEPVDIEAPIILLQIILYLISHKHCSTFLYPITISPLIFLIKLFIITHFKDYTIKLRTTCLKMSQKC